MVYSSDGPNPIQAVHTFKDKVATYAGAPE